MTHQASPWSDSGFRRLLAIFMFNGVAAAIPATLLPFFVADRLQARELQPLLLLCYFWCGGSGLPLWVKAVSLLGPGTLLAHGHAGQRAAGFYALAGCR